MSMSREERLEHAAQLFEMVWGHRRESYDTLDACIGDLHEWADELETSDLNRTPNQKIANAIRLVAERLEAINLEEGAA